jgi:hypothetical protein
MTVLKALATILTDAAIAEPPTPRQPIGPAPMNEMLPPMMPRRPGVGVPQQSPLPPDRIRVVNIGDQKLFISYWDGESAWKAVPIDAGASTEVACPKCAGTITVAYHNGKENKSIKAKGGDTYILGWSTQAGIWVFTSSVPQ